MDKRILVISEIIYFELNNWFPGEHYPNEEPFKSWCGNDLNLYFDNEEWIKENKLVVVRDIIDMSVNWCITATKEWVENNCPKLLSDESTFVKTEEYKYSNFLRHPNELTGEVYGIFGTAFMEWSEENIGLHYVDEEEETDDKETKE